MPEADSLRPEDVAVIVPVGGTAPAWERSAQSLARLDPPPGEIIVVLDGPNQRQQEIATKVGARVIVLEKQGGPARARNRGAQASECELLFFIDSDIEVPTGLIAQVVRLFPADGPVAVIGSYDDAPGDPGFFSQYRNLLHHYVHQIGREEASTFWSGCGAVRRLAFEEVSGFDESFTQPSIEDIELGSRLIRGGHQIRLVKDLQVKHLKQWRLYGMLHTDLWRRAVPWTRQMLGDGGLVNDLNVKTRDRVSVVAAFLALGAMLLALGVFFLGGPWLPILLLGGVTLLLIPILNPGTFAFYLRQRGVFFMLRVLPVYWGYLLICGLGFALGLLFHVMA